MPANLSSFQSIVQLISGTNLAVYALPKLGQSEVDIEEKRWISTISHFEATNEDQWLDAKRGSSEFQANLLNINIRNVSIRNYSLGITIVSALYLVWMSAFPDFLVNTITYLIIVVGSAPAVALYASHARLRAAIELSRAARSALSECHD